MRRINARRIDARFPGRHQLRLAALFYYCRLASPPQIRRHFSHLRPTPRSGHLLQKRASNYIWQYFGKYFAGVQAGCGPGADDKALRAISARQRFFIDFCRSRGAECARQFQAPISRRPVINSKLSLWQGFWFGPEQAGVYALRRGGGIRGRPA